MCVFLSYIIVYALRVAQENTKGRIYCVRKNACVAMEILTRIELCIEMSKFAIEAGTMSSLYQY